jgi:hypothetical protein
MGGMFILRATAKLRQRLGASAEHVGEHSTTVLGDWYATMLRWRPQVALLVNERTLLPVFMALAPAATMPARVADHVGDVLGAHGVPDSVMQAEVERMRQWRIAPTASRSVVGIMNEFTFLADTFRDAASPDLVGLAVRLAATPCSPLYKRHVSPGRELAALLDRVGA